MASDIEVQPAPAGNGAILPPSETRLAIPPDHCARLHGGSVRNCPCRTATSFLECPPEARGILALVGGQMVRLAIEQTIELPPRAPRAPATPPVRTARGDAADRQLLQAEASRAAGYTGDMCEGCGNFKMRRNGTCLRCDACGGTNGCS